MIILNNENFCFLKPRKVAGTSFEIALSRYAQANDIVTPISPRDEEIRNSLGFSGPVNYLDNDGNKIFNNHISAAQVQQKIGISAWEGLHKVAIVRNPFDVYISLFFYHNGLESDLSELSGWYLGGAGASYLGANHKQYFIKGKLIIDKFVRYEHFGEDILLLEKDFPGLAGLYNTFRLIKAKSGLRPSASYDLSSVFAKHGKLKSRIERLHDFEISEFGYSLS